MPHVVLLGDSIFDNAAYVGIGLSVIEKLRCHLQPDWQATLLANDGDVTQDVHAQTKKLPAHASHLIVSCGGNDALGQLGLLQESTTSIIAALNRLAGVLDAFRSDYRAMLDHVRTLNNNVAVCTIYDAIPQLDRGTLKALALFNDVIVREAARAGVPLIDLRLICTERSDYSGSSPIEPSENGGEKIAGVIAGLLTPHGFAKTGCGIYGAINATAGDSEAARLLPGH
jgi:hypothetical protein